MTDRYQLMCGLLNLAAESENDGDISYAIKRLNELLGELGTGWDGLLSERIPQQLRGRVTKLLSSVHEGSPDWTRTSIRKVAAILTHAGFDWWQALDVEALRPPPPPEFPRVIFPGACSKGRGGFLFVAERNGSKLRLAGTEPLRGGTDHSVGQGEVGGRVISDFFSLYGSDWHCPFCGTGQNSEGLAVWVCAKCGVGHCLGDLGGILTGRCGECRWYLKDMVYRTETSALHVEEQLLPHSPPRVTNYPRLEGSRRLLPAPRTESASEATARKKWWRRN